MNEFSAFKRVRDHLNTLGLGEMVDELLRPGSPLAFLAAQALRVAQPTVGAFTATTTLAALTRLADELEGRADSKASSVLTANDSSHRRER
jgi:hypothetical protein